MKFLICNIFCQSVYFAPQKSINNFFRALAYVLALVFFLSIAIYPCILLRKHPFRYSFSLSTVCLFVVVLVAAVHVSFIHVVAVVVVVILLFLVLFIFMLLFCLYLTIFSISASDKIFILLLPSVCCYCSNSQLPLYWQ